MKCVVRSIPLFLQVTIVHRDHRLLKMQSSLLLIAKIKKRNDFACFLFLDLLDQGICWLPYLRFKVLRDFQRFLFLCFYSFEHGSDLKAILFFYGTLNCEVCYWSRNYRFQLFLPFFKSFKLLIFSTTQRPTQNQTKSDIRRNANLKTENRV